MFLPTPLPYYCDIFTASFFGAQRSQRMGTAPSTPYVIRLGSKGSWQPCALLEKTVEELTRLLKLPLRASDISMWQHSKGLTALRRLGSLSISWIGMTNRDYL